MGVKDLFGILEVRTVGKRITEDVRDSSTGAVVVESVVTVVISPIVRTGGTFDTVTAVKVIGRGTGSGLSIGLTKVLEVDTGITKVDAVTDGLIISTWKVLLVL